MPLNFQVFCQIDGAHLVEIDNDRENSFMAGHARLRSAGNNQFFSFSLMRACFVCLFDSILYVPSTIFQLNRDGYSWVEPVLS